LKRIRRYLVAGILVWAPLAVTWFLLKVGVGLMDKTLAIIPARYQPDELLGFHVPGLGVILTVIVLLVTGLLAANFVGRAFVGGWESLMDRIPVVRAIYSAAKNFAEMVFSDSSQSFKKVLLIQYPRKGLYSLAFQTSSQLGEVQGRTGEEVVRKDIIELDMDVDEALKMIISLGVVVPTWRKEQTAELPFEAPDDPA